LQLPYPTFPLTILMVSVNATHGSCLIVLQ
jgi:hypothetical protein